MFFRKNKEDIKPDKLKTIEYFLNADLTTFHNLVLDYNRNDFGKKLDYEMIFVKDKPRDELALMLTLTNINNNKKCTLVLPILIIKSMNEKVFYKCLEQMQNPLILDT